MKLLAILLLTVTASAQTPPIGSGCQSSTCVDWDRQIKNRPAYGPGYPVDATKATCVANLCTLYVPVTTSQQGISSTVDCWSGPLVYSNPNLPPAPGWPASNLGHVSGNKVFCSVANDGFGNITITWFGQNTVQSALITVGGLGDRGPSGIGAIPFTINATTSPQLITGLTHQQSANISVDCWDGPLFFPVPNGVGNITGNKVFCAAKMSAAGNGDVTVTWGGSTVGSIMISSSGRPAAFSINATTSPQTILETTHLQGFSPIATCWDQPMWGATGSGHQVYCDVVKDNVGNVTVTWGGSVVQSIQIQ
jgi:hypothetical protein